MYMDAHSVGNETKMTANDSRNIRMRQMIEKSRNSPYTDEIATSKPTNRWKRVSNGNSDVKVERAGEVIVPSVDDETAGDSDGNPNGGDRDGSDGDGMASGSSIDSSRAKAVQLAGESQHMRWSRRNRTKYSPGSSRSPIRYPNRPYGDVRHRRRHGRIKFVPAKVSQTVKVEMTYLEHTSAMQPR